MSAQSTPEPQETPVAGPEERGVRIEPMDSHNRALVDAVHPPDWINPEPLERYHLVVIGAGTGGLVTASIAASLGAKVALVERSLMGGDCLNVGCVPSKAIIRAARAWDETRHASERFGGPRTAEEGDFAQVMERMRALRASIAPHDGAQRFADLGIHVFLGEGRFTGRDTLDVEGSTLRFRRAVIATGARAALPPIPGLDEAGALTNETLFSLTERPERLVVLGGGPIGLEMAQTFARLGSEVHVLDMAERVMPREDPEAGRVVQAALERDGVRLHLGATAKRVERRENQRIVAFERAGETQEIEGDALLVAVGRAPNIDGLGLEEAGVRSSKHGVVVDDRLRTSNRRIYAVGDVASRFKFTHAADAHARMVVANALFFGRQKASRLVMPWTTYTSPEVAHTGLNEEQARAAGHDPETLTMPLAEIDRARLDGDDEGFLKLVLARGSDRILGATIVAEHAGEMIGEITTAMNNKLGLGALGKAIRSYPTQAEVIRRAADAHRKRRLTPRVKRLFELFFRIVR